MQSMTEKSTILLWCWCSCSMNFFLKIGKKTWKCLTLPKYMYWKFVYANIYLFTVSCLLSLCKELFLSAWWNYRRHWGYAICRGVQAVPVPSKERKLLLRPCQFSSRGNYHLTLVFKAECVLLWTSKYFTENWLNENWYFHYGTEYLVKKSVFISKIQVFKDSQKWQF